MKFLRQTFIYAVVGFWVCAPVRADAPQFERAPEEGFTYMTTTDMERDQLARGFEVISMQQKTWPAQIVRIERARDEISYKLPGQSEHRYGGLEGYDLKVLYMEGTGKLAGAVVLRSSEKTHAEKVLSETEAETETEEEIPVEPEITRIIQVLDYNLVRISDGRRIKLIEAETSDPELRQEIRDALTRDFTNRDLALTFESGDEAKRTDRLGNTRAYLTRTSDGLRANDIALELS